MGPLAFTILLTAAMLVFLSMLIRQTESDETPPCRICSNGCGHPNPPVARYCARCGRLLGLAPRLQRRAG
jgi:hypothetical protein